MRVAGLRGHAATEVAARLGVGSHSLYQSVKRYSAPSAERQKVDDQQGEMKRLKAKLKRVTEERDILKKAAVSSTSQRNSSDLMAFFGDVMPRTGRPGLSAQQKKELSIRWKDGQSLSEIGRALGKHAGSIHGVLAASGGIAPRERRRCLDALTVLEREEISRSLAAGSFVPLLPTLAVRRRQFAVRSAGTAVQSAIVRHQPSFLP